MKIFGLTAMATALLGNYISTDTDFDETWGRNDKHDWIWEKTYAEKGTSAEAHFPFKAAVIFFTDMHLPFADTDFMQKLHEWLPIIRPKTIHVEGVTQKARYEVVPNSEGYTGMFASGAEKVLIRYSVATPYKADADKISMVPAMAMKMFRDGMYSANTIAMSGFLGTANADFFDKTFSNHIAKVDQLPFSALAAKFATATKYCFSLGLRDWGDYDKEGNKSAKSNFPFKLEFEPMMHIPTDTKGTYFNKIIEKQFTQTNQLLLNVYAIKEGKDKDDTNKRVLIGKYISEGPAITSLYADSKVMFSHNYMEKDVEVHPEWEQHLTTCAVPHPFVASPSPTGSKCPFGFV